MRKKPVIVEVAKIFDNVNYEIPIYQRNYAWGEKQIHQLIDDINEAADTYFLGNLIVNQKENNRYEVIDGQQRLTTLYLLETYLGINIIKGALYFEAREKANRTLSVLGTKNEEDLLDELKSEEISRGYKIIENYFLSENINLAEFKKKLYNVQIIRIQVPLKIDLNHYFEIMNTRGEQLEFHEIAKAKILSKLNTKEDKKVGALLWECCSNMNSYVQMNFDSNIRAKVFSDNWTRLKPEITNFDTFKEVVRVTENHGEMNNNKTLLEILKNGQNTKSKYIQVEDNERFESIISFPNFVLQVNKAINEGEENESMLDDKKFIENIARNWENEYEAKTFLFNLLRCRILFDKYIVKREFVRNYKEDGNWSLQRLEAYRDKNGRNPKPMYISTYDNNQVVDNRLLRTLQSCLRITYTSPKTMHWISLVLRNLIIDENYNLIKLLEEYSINKVNEKDYENCRGFGFQRIVFTYLDYILYRDGYIYNGKEIIRESMDNWQFKFRNSIEHFYPQNPVEVEINERWDEAYLDGFGNLALITVSGNSKFSNLPPAGKISSYDEIFKQSLKLTIMKSMTYENDGKWTKEISNIHEEEMFRLLKCEKIKIDNIR